MWTDKLTDLWIDKCEDVLAEIWVGSWTSIWTSIWAENLVGICVGKTKTLVRTLK